MCSLLGSLGGQGWSRTTTVVLHPLAQVKSSESKSHGDLVQGTEKGNKGSLRHRARHFGFCIWLGLSVVEVGIAEEHQVE